MSLQSWKDEFYPKEPTKRMTKIAALRHSIQKWTGLLPKNLEKHGVSLNGTWLNVNLEGGMLIDASSCALCVKFLSRKYNAELKGCAACPLAQFLGNECDKLGKDRPYNRFVLEHDPKPMLRALKATLKNVEAGEI